MRNFVSHFLAAAAFGLEGPVASELKRLGMKSVEPVNGGVRFEASVSDAFLCNLRLRFSDRIYMILFEDNIFSFEELFQAVYHISWEKLMRGNEAINISAQCARSRLMSPRDCQSISKKAIIERMKKTKSLRVFPEDGAPFPVHISIHSDLCRILLDTSGTSLSKRGYRTWNGEAPLRETLAAALVEFSPWRPGMPLYDPCCGTGTILIEAALRQAHIAPGLNRSFAMESFSFVSSESLSEIRKKCTDECVYDAVSNISGSDINPEAVDLAQRHICQAGLKSKINVQVRDLKNIDSLQMNGVFVCNPPYGERLSDRITCHELYKELCVLQKNNPTWSLCAISSDSAFEKAFGRKADKKRRLYNGRLECDYYIYLPLNSGSRETASESRNGVSF